MGASLSGCAVCGPLEGKGPFDYLAVAQRLATGPVGDSSAVNLELAPGRQKRRKYASNMTFANIVYA